MGVHGLWRLIEPSGKPVALETLENKVLAVDVSIWLHQAVKGFQDSNGAPVPNAHLLGIYHRVCKLLYFKIKPIFIFDGGVPVLKKQTIAKRNQQKSRNVSEAEKLQRQLLNTILKHSAISKVLSEKTKASLTLPQKKTSKHENMYALPPSEMDSTISSSEDEEGTESITDTTDSSSPTKHWDLHTIDMASTHFKSLPVDVRHEILTELKETRKQNSWGRLHELPKQSDDFSSYQMNRLLKRQAVQSALEDAEKEMGGHSLSLAELESILKDHGVATTNDIGKRIASDENTRYLYIKDVKQALEKARRDQQKLESAQEENNENTKDMKNKTKADLEFEEDLETAIALSLQEEPSTSNSVVSNSNNSKKKLRFSFLENFNDGDFESEDDNDVEQIPMKEKFSSAQSYMMEYSGLTPSEINKILDDKKGLVKGHIKPKQVVEEIAKTDNKNTIDKPDLDVSSTRNDSLEKRDERFIILENNDIIKSVSQQDGTKKPSSDINLLGHIVKVTTTTESAKTDYVDVLSNSDISSCDDFEEVSETTIPKDKDLMEIIIDPSRTIEDDLFGEVFPNIEQKRMVISQVLNKAQSDLITDFTDIEKMKVNEKEIVPIVVERSATQNSEIKVKNAENNLSCEDLNNPIDSNQHVLKDALKNHIEVANVKEIQTKLSQETVIPQNSFGVEFQNLNIEQMTKPNNYIQREKIGIVIEKSSTKEEIANTDNKNTIDKPDLSDVSSTTHDNLENRDERFMILKHNDIIKSVSHQDDTKNPSSDINLLDRVVEVTTTTESAKTDYVDVLSNSDTSSCDDFEEVSEATTPKDKGLMEILIDPSQTIEDDLFGEVFKNNEQKKMVISEVFNKPHSDLITELSDIETMKQDEKEKVPIVAERSATQNSDVKGKNVENNSIDSNQDVHKEALKLENYVEAANINKIQTKLPQEIGNSQKSSRIEFQNLNIEQMTKLKNDLQREKIDIIVEKSTKERMASNITDQMYQEAQDLLELFGVPYIIAPMEAEAQCAFLDAIELTDGTITDDSDIWLFGGCTVYKNFFNQSKYVMEFKVENITHNFKLTREQMILLALLVGSDYTIGLQGVGPVTALEILAAFPPTNSKELSLSDVELLSGLKEFRSWFNKGKSAGPGRSVLKNKLKNIAFTDNFPSLQVVQAYLAPTVEASREKFSWSKPDFVGLTDFAKEKFGWSSKKTEEILKPVIKKVEEQQSQKSIKDYFKTASKTNSTEALNQMSKRVKSAINRIGKTPQELIAEEMEALSAEKQKKSRKKKISDSHPTESKSKQKNEEPPNKPKRTRKKNIGDTSGASFSKDAENTKSDESKPKKSKTRANKNESSEQTKKIYENSEDIKQYEDIAMELKRRRQRRNELPKKDDTLSKTMKPPQSKTHCPEIIPEALKEDEEIELLKATTTRSLKRAEEINQEIKNNLEQEVKKQCLPRLHKKEVIHQKLRDKSDLLKNKMKAIEIFRKSKKGPGYIPKRGKKKVLEKEDAELSENSDD